MERGRSEHADFTVSAPADTTDADKRTEVAWSREHSCVCILDEGMERQSLLESRLALDGPRQKHKRLVRFSRGMCSFALPYLAVR